MFLSVMKKVCTFPSDTLIWRIQEVEIGEVLKRMKGGKAMGPDGIPIEVWRCIGDRAIVWLTKLFNLIFRSRCRKNGGEVY